MTLGALFPSSWVMQKAWELLLPGFIFMSSGTFFPARVESFISGLLTAAVFIPIFNYLVTRGAVGAAATRWPPVRQQARPTQEGCQAPMPGPSATLCNDLSCAVESVHKENTA